MSAASARCARNRAGAVCEGVRRAVAVFTVGPNPARVRPLWLAVGYEVEMVLRRELGLHVRGQGLSSCISAIQPPLCRSREGGVLCTAGDVIWTLPKGGYTRREVPGAPVKGGTPRVDVRAQHMKARRVRRNQRGASQQVPCSAG